MHIAEHGTSFESTTPSTETEWCATVHPARAAGDERCVSTRDAGLSSPRHFCFFFRTQIHWEQQGQTTLGFFLGPNRLRVP